MFVESCLRATWCEKNSYLTLLVMINDRAPVIDDCQISVISLPVWLFLIEWLCTSSHPSGDSVTQAISIL